MAKLHNTSVNGNLNASGTIFSGGRAVAPLEHTHNVNAITGLEQSVKNIVNSAPVNTSTNSTQLGGKAADQYALKTDLTALSERLNQIQYSITKVFKCPAYTSFSYDNNYVKITLSDRLANSTNKTLIIEDNTFKFVINSFTQQTFYNNKIIIKDKIDMDRYNRYSDTRPTIYRVSDTTFIVGGICTSTANELASITLQSNEPITANDFTISARDHTYNLNTASAKIALTNKELIPHFAKKYIATPNFGYLYTLSKPNTSDRRLDIHLASTSSTVYIYSLSTTNKLVLGFNGNGITLYYAETLEQDPSIAISGLDAYIDLSTIPNDFVILGNCIANYSTSTIPSFAPPKTLPATSGSIDERVALSFNQVLDLLGRSVTINGTVYDTKYNIDTNSTQTYPVTYINNQAVIIGSTTNTITARANGGNADTVGGLSPNSFITTDNLAHRYFSKVAVYDNNNHLIHPDGTEEWIEYQRAPEADNDMDHL